MSWADTDMASYPSRSWGTDIDARLQAENMYTAREPIFISYHASMDRLAGVVTDAHPEIQGTSSYLLQPFMKKRKRKERNGTERSYKNLRHCGYATIEDMAKKSRHSRCVYGPLVCVECRRICTPLPCRETPRRRSESHRWPSAPPAAGLSEANGYEGSLDGESKEIAGDGGYGADYGN